jgi:hypothetical protein
MKPSVVGFVLGLCLAFTVGVGVGWVIAKPKPVPETTLSQDIDTLQSLGKLDTCVVMLAYNRSVDRFLDDLRAKLLSEAKDENTRSRLDSWYTDRMMQQVKEQVKEVERLRKLYATEGGE